MHLLSPLRSIRRHLGLLGAAVLLTQVPALPLLILCGNPGPVATLAYAIGSVASAFALMCGALAYWERFERIVKLVRSYAENRRLPAVDDEKFPLLKGPFGEVKASLASLDSVVKNLEEEAARDHLTGILNRRTCVSRLEVDLARSHRSETPFSIVILDLDELKAINDEHGHMAGDLALRHLATVLQEATREGDWVARWGGDEFVLGLWDADAASAMAVATRVASRLLVEPCAIGQDGSHIGMSAGIGQTRVGDDAGSLFARTDEALLAAKRDGKGRIALS